MSAIWGVIHLEGKNIGEALGDTFHEAYRDCVIDRSERICRGPVLMGLELQCFTPQAKKEKIYDSGEEGACFVSDVYLDDREELLRDPIFNSMEDRDASDGEILRRYFEAYGTEGLNRVYGSYAFVRYDAKLGLVSLGTDHMSNRCLYYAVIDQVLYFSTLMEPIRQACRGKLHENRPVLEDFLAMEDMRVYRDCEATIYSEIRRAAPGEVLQITEAGIGVLPYWNPLEDWKPFRGKNDETYRAELRELLQKAVHQAMRTQGEVGIFLSGGLDSTAVACVAARELREEKRYLQAYTMVPVVGYVDDTGERVNVDEEFLVRATSMYLGNVKEHYASFPELNSWDCLETQLRRLEGPFKSMQNVSMLCELGKMARADGCRIVLNGQLGNDTISYGDTAGFLYELFRRGHLWELWKETGTHSRYFRYNRKKVVRQIWERAFSKERPATYREFRKRTFLKEYSETRYQMLTEQKSIRERREYLGLILDKTRFRQIGDNETKTSLYAGVLIKDPTRNVPLLEWCLKLPSEQFNKGCTNRRLIYEYLSDLITPEILDQRLPKGRQSADEFYRLLPKKDEMIRKMRETFETGKCPLLDKEKLLTGLRELEEAIANTSFAHEKSSLGALLYAYEIWKLYEAFF